VREKKRIPREKKHDDGVPGGGKRCERFRARGKEISGQS